MELELQFFWTSGIIFWTLLSFWSKSVCGFSFQFCVVVPLCAMGFLELVFAFWSGLLIWCVVMVHRIYDEVKRQKPSQGEGVEKCTQFPVWTSSSTTRATRRASTQTSWDDMEFLMAPHGKVLHRQECRYLERCSKTVHLCQLFQQVGLDLRDLLSFWKRQLLLGKRSATKLFSYALLPRHGW